jgi:hypothetical protein
MLRTLTPPVATKASRRWHAEEVRARLKINAIISRLERCALGRLQMTKEQLTAARILLAKALPDLVAIKHSGNVNVVRPDDLTDAELASIATGRSVGTAEPAPVAPEPVEVH